MIDRIIERFATQVREYNGTNLHKLRQFLDEIVTDEVLQDEQGHCGNSAIRCNVTRDTFRNICPTVGQYRPVKKIRKGWENEKS